jgi:hypothetical protein
MTHLFAVLSALNVLLLLTATASGFLSLAALDKASHETLYLVHFILGLGAALTTLLVHCLQMTYFLGTGRWVKEVCLAYGLPDADLPRKTRDLKRGTTPWAILAMCTTIACAAAGEADRHAVWPAWIHLVLAFLAVLINLHVHRIQYRNIRMNGAILEAVMTGVERRRAEEGLPSNLEVLQQQEE